MFGYLRCGCWRTMARTTGSFKKRWEIWRGWSDWRPSELDVRDLYLKNLSLFESTYQSKEAFQNLINFIEEGKYQPVIAKEFPLKDMVEAQKAFLSKTLVGKWLLTRRVKE